MRSRRANLRDLQKTFAVDFLVTVAKLNCLTSSMPEKSLNEMPRLVREQHEKAVLAF